MLTNKITNKWQIMPKYLESSKIASIKILCLIITTLSPLAYADSTRYITPTFVHPITLSYDQYNEVNPSWSSNGKYISFERYNLKSHEIVLANKSGKKRQTIISKEKEATELDTLFSEDTENTHYNTGISWSSNNTEFVFISSGKENNFDLFTGKIGTDKTQRLTFNERKDSQAKWSPKNNDIVFVSAREGQAGLYIINIQSKKTSQLLSNDFDTLHPVWSPDGSRIALMIKSQSGYQIYIINNIKKTQSSLKLISKNSNNNIRPSWSPDGKNISYFATQNNQWNIVISTVNDNNNDPTEKIVATNVVQNSSEGPTWLPDSKNIAYIKNEKNTYNPIYIVNTESNKHGLFLTNTRMNFDLSCSTDGILAFQSQDKQWSRIYIAGIPGFNN